MHCMCCRYCLLIQIHIIAEVEMYVKSQWSYIGMVKFIMHHAQSLCLLMICYYITKCKIEDLWNIVTPTFKTLKSVGECHMVHLRIKLLFNKHERVHGDERSLPLTVTPEEIPASDLVIIITVEKLLCIRPHICSFRYCCITRPFVHLCPFYLCYNVYALLFPFCIMYMLPSPC